MEQELQLERTEHTLVCTVQRGSENLFTGAMIDNLADAVTGAARGRDLRFVRLRARGRVFCVGREREGNTTEELRIEAARIVRLNEALRSSPLTVVAEVQGDAAGFGVGLVAASDVAIASREARFWFPEILGGLAPSIVVSWLSKTIPHKVAFDLVVTGDAIDAPRARELGLITDFVAPDRVEQAVSASLKRLADTSAGGLREIKEFFVRSRGMDAAAAAWASVDPLVLSTVRARAERRASHAS